MTYGKPCVIRHVKANACRTHGKPCVHMHANGEVYKRGGKSVRRGGEEQKGNEGKKKREKKIRERKRRKGERKRGKRKSAFRQSKLVRPRSKVCIFHEGYIPRDSDSSYFGLFSIIRDVGLCLCPKGMLPYFDPTH